MDPCGRARAALDPATFDAAIRGGGEMTIEEAVAYDLEIASPRM
jgi:hypothetical protein